MPPETKFIYQPVSVFETGRSLRGLKDMGYSEWEVLDEMRRFIERFIGSCESLYREGSEVMERLGYRL